MKRTVKRIVSILLCAFMLAGVMSSTALGASKTSGKCGEKLNWSYDKKSKTLSISGKGEMKNYSNGAPWASLLAEERVKVVVNNGVTSIGEGAFQGMSITKVSLPSSLKSIGANAFGYSTQSMGSMNCSVSIPKNVTKIGNRAFASEGIKAIKVKKGNKKFVAVDGALFNKAKTTLIAYPSGKKGDYAIPKGTKTIQSYAFFSSTLKRLSVPTSVKKIGNYAFLSAGMSEVYFKGSAPAGFSLKGADDFDGFTLDFATVYYPKSKASSWKKVVKQTEDWDFGPKWKTWKG